MHSKKNFEFETETEASEFVKFKNKTVDPSTDQYISGPMFMDETKIFKNMEWANRTRKYWLVTVESFS